MNNPQEQIRAEWHKFCNTDNFSAPPYEVDRVADFFLERMVSKEEIFLAVKNMRRDMTKHEELKTMGIKILDNSEKVFQMNEDVGWNTALFALLENLGLNIKE